MLHARWARPPGLLLLMLACLPPVTAQDTPDEGSRPEHFITEIQLSVDRVALGNRKLESDAGPRLASALAARGKSLTGVNVDVEVRSLDDVRVRFPTEKVREGHLTAFVRAGAFELRHLDSVQTSLNGGGRYQLQTIATHDASGSSVQMSFREVKTGRSVPIRYVLDRSPKVADNADLEPGSAVPQLGAAQSGATPPGGLPSGIGASGVRVELTRQATQRLRRLGRKPGRLLALVLDGEILDLTSLHFPPEPKRKGRKATEEDGEPGQMFVLTGNFQSADEVEALAHVLNSSPLPMPLRLVSKQVESK